MATPTIAIELVKAAGAADLVGQQLDLAIRKGWSPISWSPAS